MAGHFSHQRKVGSSPIVAVSAADAQLGFAFPGRSQRNGPEILLVVDFAQPSLILNEMMRGSRNG